jgi:hypothetical protein
MEIPSILAYRSKKAHKGMHFHVFLSRVLCKKTGFSLTKIFPVEKIG